MVACTRGPAFSRFALRQTSPRVAAPAICTLCSSACGWQLRFFPTLNPFVTQLLVSASVPPRFSHLLRHTYASMARDGLPCQAEDPLRHTIDLAGESVQVVAAPGLSDTDFRNAIDSSLFKQWLKNMRSQKGILADGDFSLRQVLIQGVDMFGRRVGFLKFKAEIVDEETGKKVPGIVFSRGEAVAVLILLESEGNTFVVLTEQARVPVGRFVLELPAGMLDDDHGDVIGTAVREVEEETGICLNLDDMVNLTAFLHPSTGCKVFPSPGGCDEEISLFLYRGHVEKEVIEALQGKQTGLREHGELIKVHVVPYDKLWCMTADAKVLTAMALYENTKREGLLPPRNLPDIPAL